MKLIVGLGNPGRAYSSSRHNVGFMVLKELAQKYKVSLKRGIFGSVFTAKLKLQDEQVVLAQPLSFMNLSGSVVKPLLKKYKISPEELLVVCDDMDLEFGRLRLRPEGSSGGHRGLESVIKALCTNEFSRLRVGVGRPHEKLDAADYVLAPFRAGELKEIKETIVNAASCVEEWVTQGLAQTMNNYNKRSKSNEQV